MTPGTLIKTHGCWVLALGCLLEGETVLVLARWPWVADQADRVHRLLDRFDAAMIIGVRFAYGLRVTEMALGRIRHIEGWLLRALLAAGLLFWWVRRQRAR